MQKIEESSYLTTESYFYHLIVDARGGFYSYWNSEIVVQKLYLIFAFLKDCNMNLFLTYLGILVKQ